MCEICLYCVNKYACAMDDLVKTLVDFVGVP